LDPEECCGQATIRLTCNCLHQLDKLVGYADRATLVNSLSGWADNYTLTGMSAGGRQVWRFTPDLATTGDTLAGVVANDPSDPVDPTQPVRFQVGQTLISFPVGSTIYRPSPQETYSSLGYWVIAPPLGSTPTVTSNIRPVVSLSGPANSTTWTTGGTIPLTATASDSDGSITRVEFYDGNLRLVSVNSSPYTYNWSPDALAIGYHTITARAIDNRGVRTVSNPCYIWIKGPSSGAAPTVGITSPLANMVFNAPASVGLEALAGDNDSTVSGVTFYANGTSVGQATVAPLKCTWNTSTPGTYALTAVVTSSDGGSTTSAAIPIRVNNPPSVTITVPAAGTYIGRQNFDFTATASDTDGTINKVVFYDEYNGVKTKIGIATNTSSPYILPDSVLPPHLNISGLGLHKITAVAVDNDNGRTTSSEVQVTITDTYSANDWSLNTYKSTLVRNNVNGGTNAPGGYYTSARPISGPWTVNYPLNPESGPVNIWSAHNIYFGSSVRPNNFGSLSSRVVFKINLSEFINSVTWDIPNCYFATCANDPVELRYSIDGSQFTTCYTLPNPPYGYFDPPPVTFSVPWTGVIYLALYGTPYVDYAYYELASLGNVTFSTSWRFGDANGDGVVDSADLSIVLAAMDTRPGDASMIDVDQDGEITSADLAIVLANMDEE
jgi:hypothetical protein